MQAWFILQTFHERTTLTSQSNSCRNSFLNSCAECWGGRRLQTGINGCAAQWHCATAQCSVENSSLVQKHFAHGWECRQREKVLMLYYTSGLRVLVHCRIRKAALSERLTTLPYMIFTRKRFPSDFFKAIHFL